ncbi:MAG TPA: DUF1569 domain-containing protein [Leptospiraceae bacterium]|nr:DUF1569 domain-containing protein [Leptospiraceae bacterium]HNF13736.1 DUF1569 domain-containing protein [Leptospiraceae bacterium]HNN03217.1 DUF1569 domain-containing protein [Leptospiraceae bacterium]
MKEIRFKSLDEAIAELKRIENLPKKTLGIWSYYQILDHCADGIESCMNGYKASAPWLIRKSIGQILKMKTFSQGYMDHGGMNPSAPKKREEGDEKKALQRLLSAADAFKAFKGKFQLHPFFDELTADEFEKLHAYHIANHLCFVEVKELS